MNQKKYYSNLTRDELYKIMCLISQYGLKRAEARAAWNKASEYGVMGRKWVADALNVEGDRANHEATECYLAIERALMKGEF